MIEDSHCNPSSEQKAIVGVFQKKRFRERAFRGGQASADAVR